MFPQLWNGLKDLQLLVLAQLNRNQNVWLVHTVAAHLIKKLFFLSNVCVSTNKTIGCCCGCTYVRSGPVTRTLPVFQNGVNSQRFELCQRKWSIIGQYYALLSGNLMRDVRLDFVLLGLTVLSGRDELS